jgi:CheY-like chemotaxis protein
MEQRLLACGSAQSWQPELFGLNATIATIEALIRRTIGEQITLDIDFSDAIDPVYADRSQLETALLNLVLNARDAMPDGGTLSIRTTSAAPASLAPQDDTPHVYVLVADTGVGMAQETRQRVLEPFFTTKGVGKGTGLGLSMVYGFVTQSGGELFIDSVEGEGTAVSLILPAAKNAVALGTADVPRSGDTGGKGEKILVVEDEVYVRAYTVSQLSKLGYRPVEAGTADEAMKLLDNEPDVALLFTDVVLPGDRNGLELARAARALKPDLPVVLTTGYSEELARDGRGDTVSMPLLPKPFRPRELAASIRDALDRDVEAPQPVQDSASPALTATG